MHVRMTTPIEQQLSERIEQARPLYHRLLLVVGPSRSGKTTALRTLHAAHGWPLLNLNLALSEQLLELSTRQRALRVARIVADLLDAQPGDTVLLDNTEMLFHPDLKQDPLRLLQSLSRNRTIVVTWRGQQVGHALTYAAPDHPEFRRFDDVQALIVTTGSLFPEEPPA